MKRSIPVLALATLLLSSCGSGSGADPEEGTVRGTVMLGPMCPVVSEASPCPDEPLADVTVQAVFEDDMVVATTTSDAQGGFSLDLVPGAYSIQAVPDDDPVRTSKPVEVDVVAGETVEIVVQLDTGIR
jgi:hypothetical protein